MKAIIIAMLLLPCVYASAVGVSPANLEIVEGEKAQLRIFNPSDNVQEYSLHYDGRYIHFEEGGGRIEGRYVDIVFTALKPVKSTQITVVLDKKGSVAAAAMSNVRINPAETVEYYVVRPKPRILMTAMSVLVVVVLLGIAYHKTKNNPLYDEPANTL